MINENEVYSLRQLEAFNALSQNEKLNLKTTKREEKFTEFEINNKDTNAAQIKLESVDNYSSTSNKLNTKQIESVKLPETPIRRVLITNQLNGAAVKPNPKAVTASVFKAIPKPFKSLASSVVEAPTNNGTISSAAQSVTASLIQSISAVKLDTFGVQQTTIIAEPSLVSRPSVVTASLFQPRAGIANNNVAPAANVASKSSTVNQLASRAEAMNKSFCMLSDDLCQPTTSEYIKMIDAILEQLARKLQFHETTIILIDRQTNQNCKGKNTLKICLHELNSSNDLILFHSILCGVFLLPNQLSDGQLFRYTHE